MRSEFPLIQKWLDERTQETKHGDLLRVLQARFQNVPEESEAKVRRIRREKRLDDLLTRAALCDDLKAFEEKLRGR